MLLSKIPPDRNLGLDLLRGLCAVSIAAYHFLAWGSGIVVQSMGTFGVYMFFIISSLAMMMSYGTTFSDTISRATLLQFFRSRAARILPLLGCMAAFSYLYLEHRSGGQKVETALLTGTGFFSLHMPGLLSSVPGAWSLGIELFFYFLFPVICLVTRGGGLPILALVFVLLVVAQQTVLAVLPSPSDPAFFGQYTMPLVFAPFFMAGILIHRSPNTIRAINGLLAAAGLIAVFGFSTVLSFDVFEGGLPFLALSALSIGTVYYAYCTKIPKVLARAAWFLGEISYSLYLSHWLAFEIAARWIHPPTRPLAYGVICLALASAITYAFEMPMKNFVLGKFQRSPAAAE